MEYIGWIGTFFGLLSFCLVSLGVLKQGSKLFSGAVVISSTCFLIGSYIIANYQGMITNIFYFIASVLGVLGIVLRLNFLTEKLLYIGSVLTFILTGFIYFENSDWFFQSIGWVCVFASPVVFVMYTQHRINDFKYLYISVLINVLFVIHLTYYTNYPLAICQFVALLFAFYGFLRIIIQSKKNKILS